ncbi:hypothetical protein IFR05_001700 [Cadophora sp. M221]|nr:hypothetical protein IFR05_001700 [Cadophora sp. M221]
MMQDNIYDASPPTSPRRRRAAVPTEALKDVPPSVPATPATDTNVDGSPTPPARHADLFTVLSTVPDAKRRLFHEFRHRNIRSGLDPWDKNLLLEIRAKVKANYPEETPMNQVMRIMWTQLEWISSHFQMVEERRAEFPTVDICLMKQDAE